MATEELIMIPCSRSLLRRQPRVIPSSSRGLRLIAVGVAKHVGQENAFHVLDAVGIERVGPAAKLLLDEFMESRVARFGRRIRHGRGDARGTVGGCRRQAAATAP